MEDALFIYLACPHCQGSVIVAKTELACRIFRHGIIKETGQQMDPHTPKSICEDLVSQDKIRGCGKPFQVDECNNTVICDYI